MPIVTVINLIIEQNESDRIGAGMKKWVCQICGFVYDESKGLPEEGIAPGTRWDDIPADWQCPDCGVGKADFDMIQME